MKNKELMEWLKEMDPEATVMVPDHSDTAKECDMTAVDVIIGAGGNNEIWLLP